ncbi:signal peptidase [Pseudooceanicola sp. 216_PA32_1]|uniref:Signal peptidase n=1 Tax=Pseudooceanicola pacificus TaxID=2676438 RepID=A0A844W4X2_9RHOB|nr:imelysin family protein [Pseudooceanicola pacificus]MWB79306.1 signal peptidase [Pseudooceanicola pacificus]
MIRTLALALTLAGPVAAAVPEVVNEHAMPGFQAFSRATSALADAAAADCTPAALDDSYNAAFDAWLGVAHLQLGPTEAVTHSIAFWPDKRGFVGKTLAGMIADQDPVADDVGGYAEVSAAARGFFALEAMLFDPAFDGYETGSYSCRLVQTIAADLARTATRLETGWAGGFADTLLSAGADNNPVYLSKDEALRALYTQLMAGLEFNAETRLGRPLGTFERPRPTRAEAWRSGRPLRNVELSLKALHGLARTLANGPTPETDAAFAAAADVTANIEDPTFQTIEDPQERLHVEILQQRIQAIRAAVSDEIGDPLGVAAGFNSGDGD